jgi:formamidopyrimidine-DNA glycosylase
MPELPEVETTVNDLRPYVTGHKIIRAEVFTERTVACPSAAEFCRLISGRTILTVGRRGKYLLFELDAGWYWIAHLRMTGSMLVKADDEPAGKMVRALIHLDNRTAIHFQDIRRFGRLWLVRDCNEVTGKLGSEPLSTDFQVKDLQKILAGRPTPVKSLLLDQTLIAGIGNMYADEALFLSGIHPRTPAGTLSGSAVARLHQAIQTVLQQGIKNKGASTDTFYRPDGIKGEAHLQFKVAHRKGETCPVCGSPIERIVVGQRGTFFCPKCQKLK